MFFKNGKANIRFLLITAIFFALIVGVIYFVFVIPSNYKVCAIKRLVGYMYGNPKTYKAVMFRIVDDDYCSYHTTDTFVVELAIGIGYKPWDSMEGPNYGGIGGTSKYYNLYYTNHDYYKTIPTSYEECVKNKEENGILIEPGFPCVKRFLRNRVLTQQKKFPENFYKQVKLLTEKNYISYSYFLEVRLLDKPSTDSDAIATFYSPEFYISDENGSCGNEDFVTCSYHPFNKDQPQDWYPSMCNRKCKVDSDCFGNFKCTTTPLESYYPGISLQCHHPWY